MTQPTDGQPDHPTTRFTEARRHLWVAGAFFVAGLVGFAFDASVTEAFRDPDTRGFWLRLGALVPVLLFLALMGIISSYPNGKRAVVGVLAPLLTWFAITYGLKALIGRARPRVEVRQDPIEYVTPWVFEPLNLDSAYWAFPSGHAGGFLCFALAIGSLFPKLRPPLIFACLWIGFTRLIDQMHYISDVLVGIALAFACVGFYQWMLGRDWYRVR